jgi:hypothetical protein
MRNFCNKSSRRVNATMNAKIKQNWTGLISPISWHYILSGSSPADVNPQNNPSSIEQIGDFYQYLNGARRPINAVAQIWGIRYLFNFANYSLRNDSTLIILMWNSLYRRATSRNSSSRSICRSPKVKRFWQKIAVAQHRSIDNFKSVFLRWIIR